jgi:hypothetical protein
VGSSGKECLGELPYEYVSESFLKKVASYWSSKKEDGKNIWQLLFNMDKTELENKVLNFYYQGYSWVWGDEATLWCYSQGKYENVIHGSESGDKVSYKVKNEGFDIQRYAFYKNADKEAGHAQTVGNNAYWVIRYATGEDLTGNDGTVTPVSGIPNSKDVYRFYHEKNIQAGTTWEKAKVYDGDIPVYDDNKDVLGYIFGLDRHLYKTCKEARQEGSTPVAIVCYAGDKPSDSGAPTFTRLAIGLENAYDEHVTALMQWGPTGQICSSKPFPESEYSQMVEQLNGYSVTEALINDSHNHRPAIVCNQYFQITKDDMTFVDYYGWQNLHTTHWFLPSAGQWALFLKSLGVWENRQKGSEVIKAINKFYEDAGVETQYRILTNGEGMWTSTEVDKDKAWVVKIDEQNGFRFEAVSKSALNTVFPFIMIYPRTARYQQ